MKKAMAMIALAAICLGTTAYAATPVKAQQDTTQKMKKSDKKKMKKMKKMKDTTKM